MIRRRRLTLPGLVAMFTLALTIVLIYVTYIFPKFLEAWSDRDQALSPGQKLIANLCTFCTNYAYLIFPLLILIFLAALTCSIITALNRRIRA